MRLLALLLIPALPLSAQTLVGTTPQNRAALIEEFTAINCGYCPEGHAIAADLIAAHPGKVVAVGLAGGGLSTPSTGQPDFRTTESLALWSQYGVNSQPRGLVDRTPYNGQLVLGRTLWTGAVNAALALPSPVNIGMATSFDAGSRELSVDVELYYTASGTGGNDHLQVLITESNIIGYQQDYTNGAQPNYVHMHVLRDYLSPLWGEEVVDNTAGHLEQRTYSFNVPAAWDINNCHVVAFVGEYQGEIYQVLEGDANGFSTGVNDEVLSSPFGVPYPNPASSSLFLPSVGAVNSQIELRDATGRSVSAPTTKASSTLRSVDVSSLPEGIYMVGTPGGAYRRFSVVH